MNSEVIVLLSSISTGVLALIALCIKFSILSKCSRVSLCWNCIEWTKKEEVITTAPATNGMAPPLQLDSNSPNNNNLLNNNLFNNISNV